MAYLQEKRILVEKKNHGWGVRNWRRFQWPSNLEEVLTKRLDRVMKHATAWKVLTAVSLLPDMYDVKILEEALDLSPYELQKQLTLLYYNGFLDREYRFRQTLVRELFVA
jgi:hypothetical protein